jgi:glycosyltransferase involved in cell wall biosynthesis
MVLSLIIPAYNEEDRLPGTLSEITRHLSSMELEYEVLVVDDGSTDATTRVVNEVNGRDPAVRLLKTPHRGKGFAIRHGMLAARGERLAFVDADLPMPVADITRLAGQLENHSVVIASREGPGAERIDEPYIRHVMGRGFNTVVRLLAGLDFQDTQCGLKCFTAESARAVFTRQTINGFGFDVEILFIAQRLGYPIGEVPIAWRHVPASRVDPVRDTVRMLADVARVRWNDWRGAYSRPGSVHPSD